eukprot:CAMPEP_0184334558 /NCGR_PEP_ID=MMETSP1089-20130417/3309_1 /TAXON_ID=38269 ORGANISM="Gloeochaete wittrockiana, Strain SAG46.84" /NCGR_SAMPLE_ID=MMETSP1089 /ASSEMBLY_ACC=CAM_ASM_000445 /LENGTH=65 /DNA_ID=CAMNT_0026658861 /DNA_START=772 /DNA_END=966 /DNA_ORIENTATION=+
MTATRATPMTVATTPAITVVDVAAAAAVVGPARRASSADKGRRVGVLVAVGLVLVAVGLVLVAVG